MLFRGTIAGSGGVGVAPGSQWIACRGCDDNGGCDENALIACGCVNFAILFSPKTIEAYPAFILNFTQHSQWTLCPTKFDGTQADCSKAPAISSNSWAGSPADKFYEGVIRSWQSAGIIPVFAQGNSGPLCGSAESPGDMLNVIAVGSTDITDEISSFSSRGPTRYAGAMKPDIVAPGRNVTSAWHTGDTDYNTISGTR